MRWRRSWDERPPRPKVQSLSKDETGKIQAKLSRGIERSPVLTALDFRVRGLRGRFYYERTWPLVDGGEAEVEVVGRVTPLAEPAGTLLLEAEGMRGGWHEVARGGVQKVANAIANDRGGTFHGLGALDKSLSKADSELPLVDLSEGPSFVFANTGQACSVQEGLYYWMGVPIPVIAEPWHGWRRGSGETGERSFCARLWWRGGDADRAPRRKFGRMTEGRRDGNRSFEWMNRD